MSWIHDLVQIADQLDEEGLHHYADAVDKVVQAMRVNSIKKDASGVAVYGPTGTLNTRHCPDHHGEQLERVSDGVFQCPRDGKIYNYREGYKTYDGENHPGFYPLFWT